MTAPGPRIVILATNGPETVGGLAAYLRGLTEALAISGPVDCVVRFNRKSHVALTYTDREAARVDAGPHTRTRVVSPKPTSLPLLSLSRRLMYYSSTQGIAGRLFTHAFAGELAQAIPAELEVLHVIGTGWEMLGPTILPIAKQRGAAVTVWPAVHPGTWGDSEFDVRFYNQTDAIFAQSDYERRRLIEIGVKPEIVHVCGLAPAVQPTGNALRFRADHGLGHRPLVLFLGRRQRYKGYHALREAFEIVRQTAPDACLVVIGAEGEPVSRQLSAEGVLDLGVCDDATKADALAACDVFCLPSSAEAFGISFVEAWSFAKPVVGGPAPAVRELVESAGGGYCSEQEPAALAEALCRLLGDAGLRRRLGDAGLAYQREFFTWDAVATRHRAVFEQAIRRRATGQRC